MIEYKRVAVLVFDDVELVDMNGPVDVFLHANRYDKAMNYLVYTVGATHARIRSEGGAVSITPRYSVADCPPPDIVVIPGRVAPGRNAGPKLTAWVARQVAHGSTILSVCIGLYTLAVAGLLAGQRATTHYLALEALQAQYPDIELVRNVRVVDDGQFVSTGGVTSGIDGALALVARYSGAPLAERVADVLVYNTAAPLPPRTLLPPAAA